MILTAFVTDKQGAVIGTAAIDVTCGEAFCDRCGDGMVCYGAYCE